MEFELHLPIQFLAQITVKIYFWELSKPPTYIYKRIFQEKLAIPELSVFAWKCGGKTNWLVIWLVFYGISHPVGYLTLNPVSIYALLYENRIKVTLFLNELQGFICLSTVKWFQVYHLNTVIFIFNINRLLVCTQLQGFKYCPSKIVALPRLQISVCYFTYNWS